MFVAGVGQKWNNNGGNVPKKSLYELQKNPLATSSADVLLSQGLKREYVAVL